MNMPKFIQIIGPQAVGKMTVGQELAKITGYKLLYNHMTIEMVRLIFDYDKEAFRKMNSIIRYEIFKEFSKSNEKGIIFTGCFDFGNNFEKEKAETDKWMSLFEENYTIELETTLEERLKRNKTANRLEHKESKRDLEWSEKDIYRSLEKYRLNSNPLGFSIKEETHKSKAKFLKQDLVKYGLPEEFVGRIDTIIEMNELTKKDLALILKKSELSIFKRYQNELSNMGITLIYNDDLFESIAEKSLVLDTGARELSNTVNYMFENIVFDVLSNPNKYKKCILDSEIAQDNTKYTLS